MERRTQVFGPAYLDRVVRIDRSLLDPAVGPPLDQSVDGHLMFAEGLELVDPGGRTISIATPDDWPGPTGRVVLSHPIAEGESAGAVPWRREVRAVSCH